MLLIVVEVLESDTVEGLLAYAEERAARLLITAPAGAELYKWLAAASVHGVSFPLVLVA